MFKLTDGLLLAAVALGALLALVGLVDNGRAPLDESTAARVNGVPIPTDELQSLLQRRAQAGAPTEALQHMLDQTLDQMINEELLIQRASELGILRRDSTVRVAILQAMQKSILSEERGRPVLEAELRAFYRDNAALFAQPLELQLEGVLVVEGEATDPAATALREGVSAAALAEENAALTQLRLPPVRLSMEALSRRFPEEVIAALETAAEGEIVSQATDRGEQLLKVVSRKEATVPDFEVVKDAVLNELQLQRLDLAYEEYLSWLRQRALIQKNEHTN